MYSQLYIRYIFCTVVKNRLIEVARNQMGYYVRNRMVLERVGGVWIIF